MILNIGSAGFIGSNYFTDWFVGSDEPLVILDKLTYASNFENWASLQGDNGHFFVQGDSGDLALVDALFAEHSPRVSHFAAESHVDCSIHCAADFIKTNIMGTFNLLESVRRYRRALPEQVRTAFRFLHVSIDEVYGNLLMDAPPFAETHPYAPNSPYCASKAASDHLALACHHNYGLPLLTTNSSVTSLRTSSLLTGVSWKSPT